MANRTANTNNKPATDMDHTDVQVNAIPSSPSGDSSDTLHENESFEDERQCSNLSPLSTAGLNIEYLSIQNGDLLYPGENTDRLAGSFYGKVKHDYTPVSAHGLQAQPYRRNNQHFHPGQSITCESGNHRNTRPSVSEQTSAAQELLTVRNSMRRMFRNADVAKWKVADYVAHREAMNVSKAQQLTQQARRGEELNLHVPPISSQKQDMMRRCGLSGNFEQVGNYSRALGEKTIWCVDWQNGKEEIAPWPCLAEMKWEGDDRAKTGVGRYPPLPREEGPVGLPWNQLQVVEQYPLDRIAGVPTMEDIYLPVDEIDDEVKHDLLNKGLEDAMDAYLES